MRTTRGLPSGVSTKKVRGGKVLIFQQTPANFQQNSSGMLSSRDQRGLQTKFDGLVLVLGLVALAGGVTSADYRLCQRSIIWTCCVYRSKTVQ